MQNENKYTFFSVIGTWINLLPQVIKQWGAILTYGVAVTALSAAFGRWSFSCREGNTGPWCYVPSNNFAVIVAFLLTFFILMCLIVAFFVHDFQQNVNQNSVFKLQDACRISKPKMKSALFVLGVIAGFIVPVLIAMAIINKPANPDYRIEFCYFTVMFIMFLVPLLQIRLSAGIAYFLNKGYIPARKIFDITVGRSFIPLLLFLLLVILMLSVHMRSLGYFNYLTFRYEGFAVVLLTDFADNVLKLACLALFLLFFQAQYLTMEKMLPAEDEKIAEPEIEMPANDDEVKPAKSAKAASKKKNKRKAQNAATGSKSKKGKKDE